MIQPKREFMEAAIREAIKAKNQGDYAIGAVIVRNNEIIAKTGNRIKLDKDPTQHAEIAAIREATNVLDSQYLENCVLYTTHEPCAMCAAAAIWAKLKGIVAGTTLKDMANYRLKNGNDRYTWRTIKMTASEVIKQGDPKPFLIEGFMREECKKLFHS